MAWTLWSYSPPSATATSGGVRALHKAAAARIESMLSASSNRFWARRTGWTRGAARGSPPSRTAC
eukprot:3813858-Alexandrium_andersonii.AAC.1